MSVKDKHEIARKQSILTVTAFSNFETNFSLIQNE